MVLVLGTTKAMEPTCGRAVNFENLHRNGHETFIHRDSPKLTETEILNASRAPVHPEPVLNKDTPNKMSTYDQMPNWHQKLTKMDCPNP